MSGHSKWSKIKHQKKATDKAKGKIFTKLAKAISIAVKEGGGVINPDMNYRLRLAIDKAKSANMPKDNIERAIEKGRGEGEESQLERVVYEAFGSEGIGIIIEAATDNKQRTVSDIKNTLERRGGVFATAGSVSHMFSYVGQIDIKKSKLPSEKIYEIILDSGAQDLEEYEGDFVVYVEKDKLHEVVKKIKENDIKISSYELVYRPKNLLEAKTDNSTKRNLSIIDALEDLDDVQKVFTNLDIPETIMKADKV